MTLISVTRTILKPTSPDDGGRGFMQGRVGPGIHARTDGDGGSCKIHTGSVWRLSSAADACGQRGHPSHGAGRRTRAPGTTQSSAGFQLALMVSSGSGGSYEGDQPATRQAMRWAQVDQQEHPASPEPPADGEPTPAAEAVPAPASDPVTAPAADPVPALTSDPMTAPAADPVPAPASDPVTAPVADQVPAPASDPMTAPAAHPVTAPARGPIGRRRGRDRRADGVGEAATSRGAGWAVAAAMAGAVVGLSVSMATSSAPTSVARPDGTAGLRGVPAGALRAAVPGGTVRSR